MGVSLGQYRCRRAPEVCAGQKHRSGLAAHMHTSQMSMCMLQCRPCQDNPALFSFGCTLGLEGGTLEVPALVLELPGMIFGTDEPLEV